MSIAARKKRVPLPDDMSLDAEVDLLLDKGGFSLAARLNVNLPGMDKKVAEELVEIAHQTCPYSKAIKGNVHVETNLVLD